MKSSSSPEKRNYSVVKTSQTSEDLGVLAKIGVFYLCPQLGPEVLPKEEWMVKIENHIRKQIEKNKVVGFCLMIQTYNNAENASHCVELLCTYLNNILQHPTSEKYKVISLSNKSFSEKVKTVKGAMEFLQLAGFKMKSKTARSSVEECLVFEGNVDTAHFENLIKTLRSVQPLKLLLDRNARVYKASDTKPLETNDDFFNLTVEEVRTEQKKRTEFVKSASKLMTKAMREMEEEKLKKKGTFDAQEPLNVVRQFVSDCLAAQASFDLLTSLGKPFSQNDYQTTIKKLNLVPAVVLNIHVKPPAKKIIIREDLIKKMNKL